MTARTLYRYLRQEEFVAECRRRIEDELGAARGRVAAALIEGASTPGPGQAAMQKIFWQRLGELADKHERCVLSINWVQEYTNDPFYQYMLRQFGVTQ